MSGGRSGGGRWRVAAAGLALALAGCVTDEPGRPEAKGAPDDVSLVFNTWWEVNAFYEAANRNDNEKAEQVQQKLRPRVDGHLALFLETLRTGTDDEKGIAAGALGFAGPVNRPTVVPALVEALAAPVDMVRINACVSLGLLGDGGTPVEPLLALLEDSSREARQAAGMTLSKVLRPGQGSSLLMDGDIVDWEGLCGALVAAETQAKAEAKAIEKATVEARVKGEPEPAGEAAAVRPTPGLRILALLPPEAVEIVRAVPDAGEIGFGDRGSLLKALNRLLKRRDLFQEKHLAGLDPPEEAKALGARRRRDLDPREVFRLNRLWLHAAFPDAIAPARDPGRVLPALLKALQDDEPLVRSNAVIALRSTRAPEAVRALVEKGLVDESKRVRLNAASALGLIGDRDAVEPLIHAMKENSGDAYVQEAIKFGLKEITGQDFGGSHTNWRNWWEDQKRPVPKPGGEGDESGDKDGYGSRAGDADGDDGNGGKR